MKEVARIPMLLGIAPISPTRLTWFFLERQIHHLYKKRMNAVSKIGAFPHTVGVGLITSKRMLNQETFCTLVTIAYEVEGNHVIKVRYDSPVTEECKRTIQALQAWGDIVK